MVIKQQNRAVAVDYMLEHYGSRYVQNFSSVVMKTLKTVTRNEFGFYSGKSGDVTGHITAAMKVKRVVNGRAEFCAITVAVEIDSIRHGHPLILQYSANYRQDNFFKDYMQQNDQRIRDQMEVDQALEDLLLYENN